MPTAKKDLTISELTELIGRSKLSVAGDFRGMKVSDLTGLRRGVRSAKVEVHVVKNTLARRAAEASGRQALLSLLTGPTALVLSFGDEVEGAKALTEYLRTSRLAFPMRGAELSGRTLSADDLTALAALPPRDYLLAQVMGTMNAPVTGLVTVLNQLIAGFVRVLDARAKQLAEA